MPTLNQQISPMNRTAFLIHESATEYHSQAKEHLSSHSLADFRKCPQLFIQKRLGMIADEDRPAYLVGRAVHTLALEGEERFNADFAVGGPINEKTGQRFGATTKAFAKWAAQQGKPVLTVDQFEMVSAMLVYGTEGIGKSTLAARAPQPVFVQTEDGLGEVNCDKFPLAASFAETLAALTELRDQDHAYQTVVVDSLDWLERLIWDIDQLVSLTD
jgi:hypothetical protein